MALTGRGLHGRGDTLQSRFSRRSSAQPVPAVVLLSACCICRLLFLRLLYSLASSSSHSAAVKFIVPSLSLPSREHSTLQHHRGVWLQGLWPARSLTASAACRLASTSAAEDCWEDRGLHINQRPVCCPLQHCGKAGQAAGSLAPAPWILFVLRIVIFAATTAGTHCRWWSAGTCLPYLSCPRPCRTPGALH